MPSLIALRRLGAALVCALTLVACGGGGSGGPRNQGGSVTPLASACPNGVGSIPGTSCQRLRVRVPGSADINVELRVTQPDPAAMPMGTVVLGSGGPGGEFYAAAAGGSELIRALSDAGWLVVDRNWEGGWFTTGFSIKQQSERYAFLLEWIDANLHQGGLLAATGNSAGASEIAYALTTWDQGQLLDAAVLTGGPPTTRIDYLCAGTATAAWAQECATLIGGGFFTCGTPQCTGPGAVVCTYAQPGATPEELEQESLLHDAAVLDFTIPVHIAVGSEDCTAAAPQALLFASSVTASAGGSVKLEFVDGAPHGLMATQSGRDAIVTALMNAALPAPAVLARPGALVRERVTILDEASGEVAVIERAGLTQP